MDVERLIQAVRSAPPKAILALGWLVVVAYAFPGRMSHESFEYLRQARTKFYRPENPPAMSGLWRALEWIAAGPTVLFLLQTVAFLAGAYYLLRRAASPRTAAWLTGALVAFPPVLVPLGVIWTHSLMAALLVLGAAALLDDRPRLQVAGIVAFLVATAVQPSAAVATLPLLLVLFRRGSVVGLGAWLVITVIAFGLELLYAKRSFELAQLVHQVADPSEVIPVRELTDVALRLGVATRTTIVQDAFTSVIVALGATPLFNAVVYLVLAVIVLAFALRRRDREVIALVASGLGFELTLVVTATGLEYRQSYWMIVTACLGAILLVARRSRT